jgi:2-phosphosulfolactate phosphatase
MSERTIDVCVSPELVHLHEPKGKLVVVIDILRATSCMTTALANGVTSITPVATLEECKALGEKGYVTAAERDGNKMEGFDLGNSPFSYHDNAYADKKVAVTTTNGTQAIVRSVGAADVIAGSFLNLSAVVKYIQSRNEDVLLHCAGWKGKMNLEDTIYAGALVNALKPSIKHNEDSVLTALELYHSAKDNLIGYLSNSSHVNRLKGKGILKDIEYCLTHDVYDIVPVMRNGELVKN